MNTSTKENKWKFDTDTETDTEETGTTETSTTSDNDDTEAEKDDVEVYGKPDDGKGTVGRSGFKETNVGVGGVISGSRERERGREKEKSRGGVDGSLMTPPLSPEDANVAKERGRADQKMGGTVKASRSGSRQVCL